MTEFIVTIPQWENSYVRSKAIRAKYWLAKDIDKLPLKHRENLSSVPMIYRGKAYLQDNNGQRFLKNTKTVGLENKIILNGQDLYNGKYDWQTRAKIAEYYHSYFGDYIANQLEIIPIVEGKTLSIGCDIYEIKRGTMPDASNMWLLEKFFEDALQECGVIPDDGPDYVTESGRKRYHWVETAEERKLVFTIKYI
jgi:hypothetical protein